MNYKVEITPAAQRQIHKLPTRLQATIVARLQQLAQAPRPTGVEKLKGVDNLYKVRCGDYRIIYQILDKSLLLIVVKIGNRREVYREL